MLSDFIGGQRFFDVGLHQQHRLGQLRMAGTQSILQRNTLPLATLADALDHQFFGDRTGQFRAMVAGQQCQQEVGDGHATACGQAVAVPIEQVAGGDDLGEALGEIVLPAPVHRCPVTIQ